MSNSFPKQFKVTAASGKRNKFSMPFQMVTTNNFGIMKPLLVKYLVPGDKITNCEIREFTRLMPMPSPTFGKIDSVTRAFFVPMRSIMHSFNEFVSFNPYYSSDFSNGSVSASALSYNVPFTSVGYLNNLFYDTKYGLSTSVASFNEAWDFAVFPYGNTNIVYFKFTLKGKRIYDFLNSIGCSFPWLTGKWDSNGTTNMRAQASQKISLLPILACLKSYIDWIVPSRFYHDYNFIQSFFRSNKPFSTAVDPDSLSKLFIPLRSFLESDFFTSAFENPTIQANGQISSVISIPNTVPDTNFPKVSADIGANNDQRGATVDIEGSKTDNFINRFTLQSLGALQSMLDRGLIAGTKIQDWLETEFGIKPNLSYLDISSYLGRFSNTISIGDVTSYADTKGGNNSGSFLGQFAGKGIGSGNAKFSYETKEHGFFVVFNEILPRTSYYQGLKPEFQMLDRFDFFQPEFDNLGMEAIPLRSLVNTQKNYTSYKDSAVSDLSHPDNVFGFTPRYAPLKTQLDVISGDFRVKGLNTGLDSWYLSRDFDLRTGFDDAYKQISPAFCDASDGTSTNNYDRIFQYTSNFADHFYQIFVFQFNMVRPMKQISDYMVDNQEDRSFDQKVIGVNVHGNDNV
ncbi:major capsid protein [Microvirus sp.]|nr:major capsid protein [Microvirus sp.]